jgi:hypothetical protein
MPDVRIEVNPEADLTTHTVTGNITTDEIISILEEFYRHPTKFLLWNLSQADLSNITGDDLRHILEVSNTLCKHRKHGKTAILAPSDLPFGLGRQYAILGELYDNPVHIESFRSYDMAIAWLLGNNCRI